MWPEFKKWLEGYEETAIILVIGFSSLLMRTWRYRIRNKHIILANIVYCFLVCLVVVPWLKVVLDLKDTTTYVCTYFMCQSAKTVVEHFLATAVNKLKIKP